MTTQSNHIYITDVARYIRLGDVDCNIDHLSSIHPDAIVGNTLCDTGPHLEHVIDDGGHRPICPDCERKAAP